MPLDRPITLRMEAEGRRNRHGEYEPGAVTDVRVWASRVESLTRTREVELEGTRTEGRGVWRIRWRSDVAGHSPGQVRIVADGSTWQATRIAETDGRSTTAEAIRALSERRRFLDIEATEQQS